MIDPLFAAVERLHGGSFGHVLDAGTGRSSMSWLVQLPCESWTAITAERRRATWLLQRFGKQFRPQDRLLVGNWNDPDFLRGETFDVVLADYLLGATDRHAPYSQYTLLRRLATLTRDRLYLIGLEPYPAPTTPAEHLIVDIAHFRDACHLLAGQRYHREYPFTWAQERLQELGFLIEDTQQFATSYGREFFDEELGALEEVLGGVSERDLRKGLSLRLAELRKEGYKLLAKGPALRCGFDYLTACRRG